ncbi:carboxylesterase 5A [Danaus plexippus]|uniref:carboxylesterase 5A n=1 Tax=Danaus plexippus TaxID=13037 RepID=UPI002AB0AD72|nr:carboxylesterase 5A [Danaus plexippus]
MWWLLLCSLFAPAHAVVGGRQAAPPEPDAAVVFTQKHGLSARLEGIKDDARGYYVFAGLRYAEPPLGSRRFQRPVRRFLAGEQLAKRHCLPCPQMDPRGSGRVIGHEDCLCLNVYAPKMPGDEEGCPVIFFIHGGNYRTGSAAPYGGVHFTQKDTILVTAQYRLGSLGFLSTGEIDASGNTGLFDLRAAMAWVKDYISFFGGDSSRITVMGHGSGGSAASLMALSPEGRSATGVAALSGAPLSPGAVRENPYKHAEALSEKTSCPKAPPEKLLNCLKSLPAEKIIMADNEIKGDMVDVNSFLDELSGRSGAGSRVEGPHDLRSLPPLVEEAPTDSLKRKHQRVPMFTGVTSAETANAVFGKYRNFLTNQVTAVKDFIKKDLIGGLRGVVQTVQGLNPLKLTGIDQVVPLPDYYQAVFDNSLKAIDALSEIVEATGDALFNFPAYQSVREWSAGAPAFLYSFEHLGNLTRGSHFLPGLALTQRSANATDVKSSKIKGPAHGDELAYLFEPLDEEGNPINEVVSSTDARVRESFIELFAKFAHRTASNNKNNNTRPKIFDFLPFSLDKEQYLKISDSVTTEKDFRFCQMGLWGGMAERVTGSLCKNILGQILNLPKLPFVGGNQISGIIDPLATNIGSNINPNLGPVLNVGNNAGTNSPLGLPLIAKKPANPVKPMWTSPFGNPFGI